MTEDGRDVTAVLGRFLDSEEVEVTDEVSHASLDLLVVWRLENKYNLIVLGNIHMWCIFFYYETHMNI